MATLPTLPPAKWNTLKFALWGGVFGGAFQLVKAITDRADAHELAPLVMAVGGGILGGATALALVSFMRNLMTRAR